MRWFSYIVELFLNFSHEYKKFLLLIFLALIAWWRFSPYSPRVFMPNDMGKGVDCSQLPPIAYSNTEPLQTAVPESVKPFLLPKIKITPLAGYSMQAKVLLNTTYLYDGLSDISSTDFLMAWGWVVKDKAFYNLKFVQAGRFGGYSGTKDGRPIPYSSNNIMQYIANVHTIPANKNIAAQLKKIKNGDNVRFDGWLVRVDMPSGYIVSSLTRTDTGAGACEVMLVCRVTHFPEQDVQ